MLDDQPTDRHRERAALTEDPMPSSRWMNFLAIPQWVKERWQVPLVLVSIVGILFAARYSFQRTAAHRASTTLDQVDGMLDAKNVDAAIELLATVEPHLLEVDLKVQGRYHATVGAVHLSPLSSALAASPATATAIIDAYSKAIACGWAFDSDKSLALADALQAAQRSLEAREAYQSLMASENESLALTAASRLRGMTRVEIEAAIQDGDVETILGKFATFFDLKPPPTEEAWAVRERAEYLLDAGEHTGLCERLAIDMRRLEAIDDNSIAWAPLHVLLGRAYVASGRPGPAMERFNFAIDDLNASGAPRGEALSNIGTLRLEAGDSIGADAAFSESIETLGTTSRVLDESRLGHSRALAQQGNHAVAADAFASAMTAAHPGDSAFAARLAKALRDEGLALVLVATDHEDVQARTLLRHAIRYVELAAEASVDSDEQRDAIRLQGVAHEALGRVILRPYIGAMDPRDAPLGGVSLTSRVEANHEFVAAGEAYLQLDSIADPHGEESDGRLVWDAATAFDLGGRPMTAVPLYMRYIEERPIDDDLRPEAIFRLAVAFHSMLDYEEAASWYRKLISEAHDIDPTTTVSSLGTRARVGLARCLSAGPNPSDALLLEAESHLRTIVDGRGSVGPEAPEYREAMFQLGRVLSSRARWPEAVEVLETALKRYAGDPRAAEYAARTGLAWTALALEAEAQLDQTPITPGRRIDVLAARDEAFGAAVARFGEAIAALDRETSATLDSLQRQLLQASYLRRADALAALGQYDDAMEQYAAIERRFGEDMAAIEALVRMSNLALANGDTEAARRATMRASIKLRRLDASGLEGPGLLDGLGTDALSQWITLQPPGGDE